MKLIFMKKEIFYLKINSNCRILIPLEFN